MSGRLSANTLLQFFRLTLLSSPAATQLLLFRRADATAVFSVTVRLRADRLRAMGAPQRTVPLLHTLVLSEAGLKILRNIYWARFVYRRYRY